MNRSKIEKFIRLAGQSSCSLAAAPADKRALGAQLLLSEVLEFVIDGLGVVPSFNGVEITDANGLKYAAKNDPDKLAAIDGLADTAYTMFWNAVAFELPLEQAHELVCDNNLEKFVELGDWASSLSELPKSEWNCRKEISWPKEVERVVVVHLEEPGSGQIRNYAVGKDGSGKVRKPSSYRSVELEVLV